MDNSIVFGNVRKRSRTSFIKPKEVINFNKHGLTSKEADELRKKYGSNSFTEKKRISFIGEFFKNLSDPIIRVLIGALVINIAFTFKNVNWVEAGGIALTVFIASFVSTVSEFSSGAAYDKLFKNLSEHTHTVLRDGKSVILKSSEIVMYDVIELSAGELIPCDGHLISGSISCDQSSLTGESGAAVKKAVKSFSEISDKSDPSDDTYLCRGSSIISGEGVMIATAVGDNTFYGKIASELQDFEGPSPLKERLTDLAKTISRLGYIGAVIVAVVYLLNSFFISCRFDPELIMANLGNVRFVASEILHALTLAISIVVVAVPEGLPMMITVVLSANMKKMMRHGVIVRKLVGIETAGSLSLLFTDKTGTVTTGEMKVTKILHANGEISSKNELKKSEYLKEQIDLAVQFCSGKNGGNLTDKAISRFSSSKKVTGYECIDRIPFDSEKKYAAALVKRSTDGKLFTIMRGAPETVGNKCTSALRSGGSLSFDRSRYTNAQNEPKNLRIIFQAVGSAEDFYALKSDCNVTDMTFVCAYNIKDEVRSAVPEAAKECLSSGVQVIMITGDGDVTAAAVAKDAGILPSKYEIFSPFSPHTEGVKLVLKAEDLHKMSDDSLKTLLIDISVISRATPADKTRLVRVAKEMGHVVGMTGDGVNDAPALKSADVGFAMGSGTDAAREAGDIIINDNNFVSITRAILFGRTIFESIRKFILFQLTMNVCAVGVSLLGPIFGVECPITITQMLWINIIMDTLGSLAFAGEAPLGSYMKMPPVNRHEKILNNDMIKRITFGGLYTLFLSMFFLVSKTMRTVFSRGDETYYLTVFFALFVFCGIANSICARTPRLNLFAGLGKNKPFIFILLLVAAVQLLMIYFGGGIFRTVPLDKSELLLAAVISGTIFPADFIFKLIQSAKRRRKKINI